MEACRDRSILAYLKKIITKNPFSKSHRRLGLEKLTFLGVCCEQPSMAAFLNSIPVTVINLPVTVINLAGFVLTAIYICIFYTYSDTNQRLEILKWLCTVATIFVLVVPLIMLDNNHKRRSSNVRLLCCICGVFMYGSSLWDMEAVAVTTEIQEELLLKMGIDPHFGIACLGKVNTVYENDRELMVQFYDFVNQEEMACDEAELGPDAYSEKIQYQQKVQEQQLMMLRQMRELSPEDQHSILEVLHREMEQGNFENANAAMTHEQIQALINRK